MRWPWSKRPAQPQQWYVHYHDLGGDDTHRSPAMSEDEAHAELQRLRQFQLTFPPEEGTFQSDKGMVTITSFTGSRAWIDTSK